MNSCLGRLAGRGQRLVIAPQGRQIRRRISSVYAPAIERAIGSELTAKEVDTLSRLLKKII